MGNFKSYKTIIKELSELATKLEKGELNESELENFQQLSKDLYERAIVLNYKAKEKKVFESDSSYNAPRNEAPSKEEVEKEKENEVVEKSEEVEDKQTITKDSPEESQESDELFSFDFSDKDSKSESEKPEQEKESSKDTTEESQIEKQQYDVVAEEEKEPKSQTTVTTERATHISSDDTTVSFYERFTQVHDQSLLEALASQKIDSLKGAFGLNDRLQIINELFDGKSEEFNEAVETLDHQNTGDSARKKLSEIAAQHQWEPDNRVVENFVKMVERRYAE